MIPRRFEPVAVKVLYSLFLLGLISQPQQVCENPLYPDSSELTLESTTFAQRVWIFVNTSLHKRLTFHTRGAPISHPTPVLYRGYTAPFQDFSLWHNQTLVISRSPLVFSHQKPQCKNCSISDISFDMISQQ